MLGKFKCRVCGLKRDHIQDASDDDVSICMDCNGENMDEINKEQQAALVSLYNSGISIDYVGIAFHRVMDGDVKVMDCLLECEYKNVLKYLEEVYNE